MASSAALFRLADRTRVPDPTLQRHAVAAFFRHLLSLPAPLPEAAHDAASALLASPHPAVAAHAAASVACLAASRPDLLPPGRALPLLLAPLAASPSPRLASCLVKAVSALAACALRSGSRFPPHDHPFVQALASGADGVRAELARQAARMVAEGLDGIVGFLRPFVMFSVVRKGDAAFARDLIGALAAAAAAAGKAGVAIPVLKLLEESMLHLGRGDDQERWLWLSSAECLVGAHVVLLRKLVHAQMPTYDAQASSAMLMEALLSQCLFHKKFMGITSTLLGLSKHLFSVEKDLGLCYLPEISGVLSSLSHSLSGLEFEHEQLVGLKLLAFLIEWKYENVLERKEQKHCLSEELLCVMAVINLAISPSKSVKAVPSSAGFIFMKHTATKVSPESGRNYLEARYWTDQLNDYLTVLCREKLTLDDLSSKKTSSESLAVLGASDPRLGMPLFVVILFYIKILCNSNNFSTEILLSLIESLPSLAIHGFVLPLALQWISPMLKRVTNPVLYATAVRLLCKIWIVTDWAFPNLQAILDPENISNFISDREISMSIASSIRDVCKHNPDRGVDLILSNSFCIESRDSVVQALGLEGLSYLCEADVVDFYTAWKVISKELLDYSIEPAVAHRNRRRVTTDKRVAVHKSERLLDVFPQAVLKGKSTHHQLPGAALLTLNFTPKDILNEGKSKGLPRVHASFEQAFTEIAESLYISRNIEVALLAFHSWKSFVSNWMQAVVALLDIKESSKLNKALKAANDIFKILCDHVPVSTPRVAVNIALVIGALCSIVPPIAHLVISSASDFLLKWLFQYEHEHQQWSAALSLGLIFNCFHPTDKKSRFQVINGLLELCPSSCYSLKKLNIYGIDSMEGMEENSDRFNDDPWAIAGLVLGLGNSVVALYRLGAYGTITEIKDILMSWIPNVNSSCELFDEMNSVSLCIGSCLALPSAVAFCQRVDLLNEDLDALFNRYTSLASELLNLNKSGIIFQNLLMAICIGAGSLLSFILDDGVHAVEPSAVKKLLDTLRHIYTHPFPPLVHLGGMFGVVNACGAGDLTGMCSKLMTSQIKHEESSLVRCPLLASPVGEILSTPMVQEIYLLAKDAEDKHIQGSAAWAISFLRSRWLSKNLILYNENGSNRSSGDPSQASSFSEQSLVWNLSRWLNDLKLEKPFDMVPVSTVGTVLKCLSKAPRLPTTDWGVIVRRCMKVETQIPYKPTNQQDLKLLREACLHFTLAHATHISPLLQFLDDLTDILRFQRLEINVQSVLLQHLSHLIKLFSDSRLDKLYEDLTEYLYSSTSSYLNYSCEQKSMIRMSFWEGICKCLVEVVSEESGGFSFNKKCIECLLPLLTLQNDGQPEYMDEWSAAIMCLTNAQKSWLGDMLQVRNAALVTEEEHIDVAKKIIIRARLCATGCGSVNDLGVWWSVLVEIAAAINSVENSIKRQWLLDALEIGCVTAHPSTVLHFVGLLCDSCCIYMPLLVVNSRNVLSDLPVTLPSFLSSSIWDDFRDIVADKLWLLTTSTLGQNNWLMEMTSLAEDYLTVDKQLKLANLESL
ncbi:protein RST1 [Panicum miliaceum]|uniref:Protein RST1 n=1 Tax=Panicum miliaceum TaxID=4540 RepID=A0A3L6QZS4_PANMI|nr:protein RST1 [Panicum miliaceum]